MVAGKALRCDCGHEALAHDEDRLVDAIRRHASEEHGVSFSVELARELARGATPVSSDDGNIGKETQ